MSSDESERMEARLVIFEAAQDMLAARLSYIEGARKIHAACFSWGLDELDADVRCFAGIHSETDALPFGKMREYWQAAALDALQPEIDKKEAWARKLAEPHCHSLVRRFLSGQIEIKTVELYDCRLVLLAAPNGNYRTENFLSASTLTAPRVGARLCQATPGRIASLMPRSTKTAFAPTLGVDGRSGSIT